MQWAVGDGIVTGTSANKLSPKASLTRGQFATMVSRYLA